MTPYVTSDNAHSLQSALNSISELRHMISTKGHLIEDIESNLRSFSRYFTTDTLKAEYESLCADWFALLQQLEDQQGAVSGNLANRTFFTEELGKVRSRLTELQDLLKSVEEVRTEVELRAALTLLEDLVVRDRELEEAVVRVMAEGKNIIRSVESVSDMRQIQADTQHLQSTYRVFQNGVNMKQKKYTAILAQLEEFRTLIASHKVPLQA